MLNAKAIWGTKTRVWRPVTSLRHMQCDFCFLKWSFFIIYHGHRDGEKMTFLPIFLQHIFFLKKILHIRNPRHFPIVGLVISSWIPQINAENIISIASGAQPNLTSKVSFQIIRLLVKPSSCWSIKDTSPTWMILHPRPIVKVVNWSIQQKNTWDGSWWCFQLLFVLFHPEH